MKLLVVDKSEEQSGRLCGLFENFEGGAQCSSVDNIDRGLDNAIANKYDLIILGITEIKSAAKNFITKLRQECGTPLIVLTRDKDVATRVEYLNIGADSCMNYDVSDEELYAVAVAILRRLYKDFGVNIYKFKSLQVNFFEKTVKIDEENISIVAKMYELFEYLIRNKEIILSKNALFNRVWGFESETTFSVVEVYISKLRKILERSGLAGQLLTIKNAGYCWTEKDNQQ